MGASKKKNTNNTEETSAIYRFTYKVFSRLVGWFFRIKVVGRENEPDHGGFMVCANHTSATDPVALCYAFSKHQVRFMAKKELFKVPVVSWLVRLMGAFPVDRGGNDVGAIKKSVTMLKEGKCMGIFPQGHRYPGVDPRTTAAKNGAALITVKAEADIVPVYIARKNNTHKLFRRTWVIIGEPIPYSELNYNPEAQGEYARIADSVFDRICSMGESFDEASAKEMLKNEKKKNK